MKRLFATLILVLCGASATAADMTEQQKIDALLAALDTPGITFVRNGEEHDGAWAKQHFVEKIAEMRKMNADAVKTADEFIADVASKSSHTGESYKIKKKDGTLVDSSTWLKAKLAELSAGDASAKD